MVCALQEVEESTLLTRAIMAKMAASGMRVDGTPSRAVARAMACPRKLGAPSAATSCCRRHHRPSWKSIGGVSARCVRYVLGMHTEGSAPL